MKEFLKNWRKKNFVKSFCCYRNSHSGCACVFDKKQNFDSSIQALYWTSVEELHHLSNKCCDFFLSRAVSESQHIKISLKQPEKHLSLGHRTKKTQTQINTFNINHLCTQQFRGVRIRKMKKLEKGERNYQLSEWSKICPGQWANIREFCWTLNFFLKMFFLGFYLFSLTRDNFRGFCYFLHSEQTTSDVFLFSRGLVAI